jgi:hypothetical protein
MQVVNDREDFGMHDHELNQSHTFTTIDLFEVDIKNLDKSFHNDINLSLI